MEVLFVQFGLSIRLHSQFLLVFDILGKKTSYAVFGTFVAS